jgi:patatin-like phospholipase/acyl hydrolase
MRGLVPCMVLAELERRAKKPSPELFDLVCGTSIGGILAAMLATGHSAEDMTKFFYNDGPVIFRKRWWRSYGFIAARYPAGPLERILKRTFGELTLADCKCNLLVISINLLNQKPYFFNNFMPGFTNFKLWEVCRATSAAQSYFPAFKMGKMLMWDGGSVANSPSLCGLASASKLWGTEEVKMLSLGCGRSS